MTKLCGNGRVPAALPRHKDGIKSNAWRIKVRMKATIAAFVAGLAILALSSGELIAGSKEFDDCAGAGWCPRMVKVRAGQFMMGSPESEPERFDDEAPQRRVAVRAFAAGVFPVTRKQYAAFVDDTHRPVANTCFFGLIKDPSWQDPGFPQADDHPVVCVTWVDARDYARWLSKKTGKEYRLLSESEWEYAARAGSTTAYPWGESASHEYANYGGDAAFTTLASGRDKWLYTSPVGSFPPNKFGLYDMHGNVFQFVQDCHAGSYEGLPLDGTAYEPVDCKDHVGRGGAWGEQSAVLRSAARNWAPPARGNETIEDYRSSGFGFRVARSL